MPGVSPSVSRMVPIFLKHNKLFIIPYRFSSSSWACVIYTSTGIYANTFLALCTLQGNEGLDWWTTGRTNICPCSCYNPILAWNLCVTEGADSKVGTRKGRWVLEGELMQMVQLEKWEFICEQTRHKTVTIQRCTSEQKPFSEETWTIIIFST